MANRHHGFPTGSQRLPKVAPPHHLRGARGPFDGTVGPEVVGRRHGGLTIHFRVDDIHQGLGVVIHGLRQDVGVGFAPWFLKPKEALIVGLGTENFGSARHF